MVTPGAGASVVIGWPSAITSSANPRASNSSSVRACTANALVMFGASNRRSKIAQRTPAKASSHASISPVGPAPMTATSAFVIRTTTFRY